MKHTRGTNAVADNANSRVSVGRNTAHLIKMSKKNSVSQHVFSEVVTSNCF